MLAGLVSGFPSTYWFLWLGTFINRLGGFFIPLLTLYLKDQRGIPVSLAGLMVSLFAPDLSFPTWWAASWPTAWAAAPMPGRKVFE